MKCGSRRWLGLVAAALAAVVGARNAGAECVARKIEIAGQATARALRCAGDPGCAATVGPKLTASFAHAATCPGDAATVVSALATEANALFAAVGTTSACSKRQLRGLGTALKGDIGLYGRLHATGNAARARATRAATATKFANSFQATNTLPGCVTTDVAATGAAMGGAVERIVATVCPTCVGCNNGLRESGEHCDQGDDAACPGQCEASCGCLGPAVCGDGYVDASERCENDTPCLGDFMPGACGSPSSAHPCECCTATLTSSCIGFHDILLPCCDAADVCYALFSPGQGFGFCAPRDYCSTVGCSTIFTPTVDCCPGYQCVPGQRGYPGLGIMDGVCLPDTCTVSTDCPAPFVCPAGACCLPAGTAPPISACGVCCSGACDAGGNCS